MAHPRSVLLLGEDAASSLAPRAPSFRDVLRRPPREAGSALARAVESLAGAGTGGPGAPDALDLLALIDLDREHRKGHNRVSLEEARRDLVALGLAADRDALAGAPGPGAALASTLSPGDAVICLGPEERLEPALLRAPALDWAPDHGYGVSFRKVGEGRAWREARRGARGGPRLLKLRGSLGWIHCEPCRALDAAAAGSPGPGEPGGSHPCVHADDQRERVVAGRALRGRPRGIFGRLRASAAAVLGRAERVVLVGAAPEKGDPFLRWVFRRAAAARGRPLHVLAAGVDAEERARRLGVLLGPTEETSVFPDLESLVAFLGRPGRLF